jgi:prevent-host-death family protein
MKYSSQIKPISYLKANAAEIVRNLSKEQQPLVITKNGEARIVMQDIKRFEQTPETIALLKILSLGVKQIEDGNVFTAEDVIKNIKARQMNK